VAHPIAALSLVAMKGITLAFDARVFDCRPHEGSRAVARIMRQLLPADSFESTTKDVQDPYSLRYIYYATNKDRN
jgi:histidine ammonia-lyase